MQIFLAFTVSAHNSVPWLERGRPRAGRPDALILDGPVWHHWPQLLLWLPFQASIFYLLFSWSISKLPTQCSCQCKAALPALTVAVFTLLSWRGPQDHDWVLHWHSVELFVALANQQCMASGDSFAAGRLLTPYEAHACSDLKSAEAEESKTKKAAVCRGL